MSRKPKYSQIKDEYARLLDTMEYKNDGWRQAIHRRAEAIVEGKKVYKRIERLTNVPWYFIGAIHSMECGLNFSKHLHNGDSLKRRTRRVPRGRPLGGKPPFTFTESAIDALKQKRFHKVKDWSMTHICFMLERYNGWGYRMFHKSTLSPYLWSGTKHYRRGKYIADGKWSSSAVSQQTGAIPLIVKVRELGGDEEVKPIHKVSRKMNFFRWVKNLIKFFGTAFAGLFTVDNLGIAKDWITEFKDVIFSNGFVIGLVLIAAIWLAVHWTEEKTKEDYLEGRYTPSGDEPNDMDEFDLTASPRADGDSEELPEQKDVGRSVGSGSEETTSEFDRGTSEDSIRPLQDGSEIGGLASKAVEANDSYKLRSDTDMVHIDSSDSGGLDGDASSESRSR